MIALRTQSAKDVCRRRAGRRETPDGGWHRRRSESSVDGLACAYCCLVEQFVRRTSPSVALASRSSRVCARVAACACHLAHAGRVRVRSCARRVRLPRCRSRLPLETVNRGPYGSQETPRQTSAIIFLCECRQCAHRGPNFRKFYTFARVQSDVCAKASSSRTEAACAALGAAMKCAAPGEGDEQYVARIRASFDSESRRREVAEAAAPAVPSRPPRLSSPDARSRAARSSESRAAGGGEAGGDPAPRAVRLSFGGVGVVPTTHSSAVHAVVEDRFRRHLLTQVALSNMVRARRAGPPRAPPAPKWRKAAHLHE